MPTSNQYPPHSNPRPHMPHLIMPPPVNVTNNHTSSSLSANPMTKQKTAPGLAMKEPLLVEQS
jgi:hypothetical protein